jgi:hypothetical protein
MDNGLGSKHRHHDRLSPASFDSPCCVAALFPEPLGTWRGHRWFRCAEISGQGMTGKVPPIVHTAAAFDPSAQEAARQETA